jgi:hypothetical protein
VGKEKALTKLQGLQEGLGLGSSSKRPEKKMVPPLLWLEESFSRYVLHLD